MGVREGFLEEKTPELGYTGNKTWDPEKREVWLEGEETKINVYMLSFNNYFLVLGTQAQG